MAYEIRNVEDDQWSVIDEDSLPVFTGTLPQCEDWLDANENRQQRSVSGSIKRLFRLVGACLRFRTTNDQERTP